MAAATALLRSLVDVELALRLASCSNGLFPRSEADIVRYEDSSLTGGKRGIKDSVMTLEYSAEIQLPKHLNQTAEPGRRLQC